MSSTLRVAGDFESSYIGGKLAFLQDFRAGLLGEGVTTLARVAKSKGASEEAPLPCLRTLSI